MFVDIYLLLWRVHELKLLWRVANTDCLPLSVLNLLFPSLERNYRRGISGSESGTPRSKDKGMRDLGASAG